MGKVTPLGRALRGVDHKSRVSIWVGIGKSSPWPDENNPPDEETTQRSLLEPIGYRRLSQSSLVKEVTSTDAWTITHAGKFYVKVSDTDALAKSPAPVLLYFRFDIERDELPQQTYRQAAVFADLIPNQDSLNLFSLLPAQVSSVGHLIYLSNEKPQVRQAQTRHVIEVVLPM